MSELLEVESLDYDNPVTDEQSCLERTSEYLIVPDSVLAGTRRNEESIGAGKICVDSLEAFVGAISTRCPHSTKRKAIKQLRTLIEINNQRVDAIEMDESMMIDIPRLLER